MTVIKNNTELEAIKGSGIVIKEIFKWLEGNLSSGMSTADVDRSIEDFIRDNGAEPAFKGYKGFPCSICASVNEKVVHGIPSDKVVLNDGDIISVDVGVLKNGFYTDAARTYAIGEVSEDARRLIEVTRESLEKGIEKAVEGNRVQDISNAIEENVKKYGCQEVRAFVGHGIGRSLHESPEVPNWGERGKGMLLEKGLLLAIEPMVNVGTREVDILSDGWTVVTKDKKLSAHFEDTIIVGKNKAEALT